MNPQPIPNGTAVTVRTDRGSESATVLSHSNTAAGEQVRYTVRFADRTQSSWNASQVTVSA